MHDRSLRPDNPNQLQIRNAKFVADSLALQKENDQLKTVNANLEKAFKETRESYDIQQIKKTTQDAETSPIIDLEREKSVPISTDIADELAWIKHKIHLLETNSVKSVTSEAVMNEVPLQRPPLVLKKPVIKSIVDICLSKKITIKTLTCVILAHPLLLLLGMYTIRESSMVL